MRPFISSFLRRLNSKAAFILLFIAAPFITFFDILILNYTISFNEASTDGAKRFGKLLPVLDPTAGSLQDHPWLFKIGQALRQGTIPFMNLENGLGAFLLESLQSGVFYPPNLLLVGMDLSSPQFFDLFQVFHVLILAVNCCLLFKLYVRWEAAITLGAAFALSHLSFLEINMVHYRTFVWTPLLIWAGVRWVRGNSSLAVVLLGWAATICLVTAGNPQETFFDFIAVAFFVGAEILRVWINDRQFNGRSLLIFLCTFLSGILVATPAILPYLISKKEGLLNTVENTVRSSYSVSPQWLLGWIIPYINGPHTEYYRAAIASNEDLATFAIQPVFTFLAIVGLFAVLCNRSASPGNRFFFAILLGSGLLGILTISSFSPFSAIIANIPFVNTIRITKYINSIHLLIAGSGAIALFQLLETALKQRRRFVLYSLLLLVAIVGLIVGFELLDPAWKFHARRWDQVWLIWIGSTVGIATCSYLLMTQRQQYWQLLLGAILISGLMMRPYGFPRSFHSHAPFPLAGIDLAKERLLSNADSANTNLLRNYERVGVFDPVLNRAFTALMTQNFPVLSGALHLQLPKDTVISNPQLALLKMMGVTGIYGYSVQDQTQVIPVDQAFLKIKDPLPRVFLLKETAAIAASCQQQNYPAALATLQAAMVSPARKVHKKTNGLQFELERSGSGILVALQAFSPAWQLDGRPATQFCGAFSTWQGTFQAGQPYRIQYLPPGLHLASRYALGGIVLLGIAILSDRAIAAHRSPFD